MAEACWLPMFGYYNGTSIITMYQGRLVLGSSSEAHLIGSLLVFVEVNGGRLEGHVDVVPLLVATHLEKIIVIIF